MREFARLLDRLAYTPARNGKLELIAAYMRATPDPDRGWALAALTDGLPVSFPVRRVLLDIMAPRIDPELLRLSREYVGDTAETVALLWEPPATREPPQPLRDIVAALLLANRNGLGPLLTTFLDTMDATERWALLKLVTGALRVGVSARLAKAALARAFDHEIDDIEEVWHALHPPYADLFAWLEGRSAKPDLAGAPVFRPMMLAHPLEEEDFGAIAPEVFAAEWKWDGVRVQLVAGTSGQRLYSRTGDDISPSFPEFAAPLGEAVVLDGELLIVRQDAVAPFNDLQQRLNRKAVTARMLRDYPAHLRLYDALMIAGEDLRALDFLARRAQLAAWFERARPQRMDLSPLVPYENREHLQSIRSAARDAGIEGLMLKRLTSPYLSGRPKGHWYKWKRAALTLDCVLMYAQRGSGKRSSFYSDYTFGVWTGEGPDERRLVPVGKAYSGFTDAELRDLDRWIRTNTTDRFGPVRAVTPGLVLEVAFDAAQRSSRHKSGVAMRFPRIHRIRWDKPAAEADELQTLLKLIP